MLTRAGRRVVTNLGDSLGQQLLAEHLQMSDAVAIRSERQHHAHFANAPSSALGLRELGDPCREAAYQVTCHTRELQVPDHRLHKIWVNYLTSDFQVTN